MKGGCFPETVNSVYNAANGRRECGTGKEIKEASNKSVWCEKGLERETGQTKQGPLC